ncbi:hypothetical protein D039_0905A, partial [Vibrio parahaemolyticus EKP-028]
MLGLFTP